MRSLSLSGKEPLLLLLSLEAFEPESESEEELLESLREKLEAFAPSLPFSSSQEARRRLLP